MAQKVLITKFNYKVTREEYENCPLVASVLSNPALENFELRQADVLGELSEITHAPIKASQMA